MVLRVVAIVLLLAASAGCGRGKLEECNRLVVKINVANSAYSNAPDPHNDAEARSLAAIMQKNATDVGAVELRDAKLLGFRDQFTKSSNESAAALIAIADAPGDATPADFKKSEDRWKAGLDGLAKLPDEINGYCR